MLQLICHHTYDTWGGLAIDRSRYGLSNGTNSGAEFLPDGANPGSGALGFERGSLVAVPGGGAWRDLGAIRVEVVVNPRFLDPIPTTPRFLVHAAGSFSLSDMFPNGLVGIVMGAGGAPAAAVTSTPPHSPDGHSHVVPEERWSRVGFSYDGLSTMELSIDGVVVGRAPAAVPIPPVDLSGGVSIGADRDGQNALSGQIDEVKIWRRDPDSLKRQFLCRPHDQRLADCWAAVFRALGAVSTAHPADMQSVATRLQRLVDSQLRAAFDVRPAALEELRSILRRYTRLWCQGGLDTDEMQSVFRDLFRWWRANTGGEPGGSGMSAVAEDVKRLLGGSIDLRCDPAMSAFVARIAAAAGPGVSDAPYA